MVQFEELRLAVEELEPEIKELSEALGLKACLSEIEQLEYKAAEPGFWDDTDNSQKILQRTGFLKNKVENYNNLVSAYEDVLTLIDLGNEEEDLSLLDEAKEEYEKIKSDLESQKLSTLLTGEYDKNNAILNFHAGSGGTEAQDWAEMLYRMYGRWAERHNFKVKTVDYLEGDTAGMKSATVVVEGTNAYGYLKSESGFHRLTVRAEDKRPSPRLRLCPKLKKTRKSQYPMKISKWTFTVQAAQAVRRSTKHRQPFVLRISQQESL